MNRTVLVTGGGTGIGRAVAAVFAADGDTVVVTGRRAAPLEHAARELGGGVRGVVCDHTDPAALAGLLASLPNAVDVLVNNAGGNTDRDAPALPATADPASDPAADLAAYAAGLRAQVDANLVTAALTTRALLPRLAPGGAVVSLGSIAADQGSGGYGAAKAALAAWNTGAARELGERGVTANVVSPGYVAETEFFGDSMTAERRKRLIGATLTGRAGTPADIAGTVAFLASPAARHITAQVLNVNGGARPTR